MGLLLQIRVLENAGSPEISEGFVVSEIGFKLALFFMFFIQLIVKIINFCSLLSGFLVRKAVLIFIPQRRKGAKAQRKDIIMFLLSCIILA